MYYKTIFTECCNNRSIGCDEMGDILYNLLVIFLAVQNM